MDASKQLVLCYWGAMLPRFYRLRGDMAGGCPMRRIVLSVLICSDSRRMFLVSERRPRSDRKYRKRTRLVDASWSRNVGVAGTYAY